jgi:AcrR family transcriptional regulator
MAGALDILGERGYLASTVAGICKAAAVSPKTFYAQFDDKESCFLAAYDVTIAWLEEQGRGAAQAAESWTNAVKAATATTLRLCGADPRLARLCAVEIFLAGPAAAARHRALVDRLSEPLRLGRAQKPLTSAALLANLEPTLIGGAFSLIARYLDAGEEECLAELAPEIVEFLLVPYLGAPAARSVACPVLPPEPVVGA